MAPIEKEPSPSKTGVNDSPALTDFQTPPAAVATYQILLLVGWTATSEIRPDVRAGPMERHRRLPTSEASLVVSAAGAAAVVVVAAAGLAGVCASAGTERATVDTQMVMIRMRRIYASLPKGEAR